MDFITDLPDSDGFTCILVFMNRLTKMFHLIPFHDLPSAIDTATSFMDHILRLHGLPEEIISDRGSQFTSKFWKVVCQFLNIDLKLSFSYHHQSNGQTERVNSIVEQYLRCFSNYKGSDWKNYLSFSEFSYDNTLQEYTGFSSFFINYGFFPKIFPSNS